MSHTYTPDDTNNPADITLPDDGDDASAESVNSPLEDLADKVAYSQVHYLDRIAGGTIESGAIVTVASGSEIDFADGAIELHANDVQYQPGGSIAMTSGSEINVESAGELNVLSGGILDVKAGATHTQAAIQSFSGTGHPKWRLVPLADVTVDKNAGSGDVFYYTSLSTNRIFKAVNGTGATGALAAQVGDSILVSVVQLVANPNTVTVQDSSAATIATLETGAREWVRLYCVNDAGTPRWVVLEG